MIWTSKKFLVAVAGVVAIIISHFIPAISEEMILSITGIIISYIIGQGVADTGKEAAKINSETK